MNPCAVFYHQREALSKTAVYRDRLAGLPLQSKPCEARWRTRGPSIWSVRAREIPV